jgi:hypothetical protein
MRGREAFRWSWAAAFLALAAGCLGDEPSGGESSPASEPSGERVSPRAEREAGGAAMPPGLRQAFLAARMAEAGPEHEFEAGEQAGVVRAAVPEQRLAFALGSGGLTVTPTEPGDWQASLRLAAVGRPGQIRQLPEARPVALGNRVSFERGGVTEWYLSGPPGLEQGFDLAERPAGEGPLALEVAVGEGLRPELDGQDGSVVLIEGERGRLRYSDLFAQDAEGRQLPARMTVEGQTIRLVVEDEEAVYPVSVDPIVWVFQQKLTASDAAAQDYFGVSVAIAGDTAVVGASYTDEWDGVDQGSVFVFVVAYKLGDACDDDGDCLSGRCVDDVCCDTSCGDGSLTDCQACSVARGAMADGACGALTADLAPTLICRLAAGDCDAAETCSSTSTESPADDLRALDGESCSDPWHWTVGDLCDAGACAGTELGSRPPP